MKQPRKPLHFDLDLSPETMEAELRKPAVPPVQPPPAPPEQPPVERQQLGVRIAKDVYKRLRMKAVADEVLVQDIVERAISELLDREGG